HALLRKMGLGGRRPRHRGSVLHAGRKVNRPRHHSGTRTAACGRSLAMAGRYDDVLHRIDWRDPDSHLFRKPGTPYLRGARNQNPEGTTSYRWRSLTATLELFLITVEC